MSQIINLNGTKYSAKPVSQLLVFEDKENNQASANEKIYKLQKGRKSLLFGGLFINHAQPDTQTLIQFFKDEKQVFDRVYTGHLEINTTILFHEILVNRDIENFNHTKIYFNGLELTELSNQ